MDRRKWIAIGATFAVGALSGAGLAQEGAQRGFGILRSHLTQQDYYVSVGVTVTGRPRLPESFSENRVHVVVPSHYGDLFQITQDGHDAILWFRTADGAIRNALLDTAGAVPYQIERSETSKLEIKVR
jgi:hypothetical protein